jgi:hypothetical protein
VSRQDVSFDKKSEIIFLGGYCPPLQTTNMVYDNLPVYKVSYDLIVKIFGVVTYFRRDYKYSLGESIKKEIIELISNIYKANSAQQKDSFIINARANIETVRLFFRLSKDLKQIDLPAFVEINKMIESISKQLTAWGKYIK